MSVSKVVLASGQVRYKARPGHGAPQRTFERKKDAEEWEAQTKRDRARGRAGMPPSMAQQMSFAAFLDLYRENVPTGEWRWAMLLYPRTKWKNVKLTDLRSEEIGAWLHALAHAPKTKTHILASLRMVLDAAVEWGYLERNPARSRAVKAPGQKRTRPIQPFTSWREVERVAWAVGGCGQAIGRPFIKFACATGLRCPSELLAMRWEDYSRHDDTLIVRGTKTKNAERIVPVCLMARHALVEASAMGSHDGDEPKPEDPVWGKFSYVNWRDTAWREGLQMLGLPHRTPYEMRHTFATLALSAGAPIDDVASAMGHADITEVYSTYRKWVPPMQDRLRITLNKIGGKH